MEHIKCIKEVYSLITATELLFTVGKTYNTFLVGNNLMAVDNNNTDHIIAYSVMHRWNEDSWFNKHFELIE